MVYNLMQAPKSNGPLSDLCLIDNILHHVQESAATQDLSEILQEN